MNTENSIKLLRKMTIKKRMIFSFILICLCPLLIVVSIYFTTSYIDKRDTNKEYSENYAHQINLRIKSLFERVGSKIEFLSSNSDILADIYLYENSDEYRNDGVKQRINRAMTSIMNNENAIGFVGLYTDSNEEFSYGESFLNQSNIDEIKNKKAIYNNIAWDTINYNNKEYIITYKKIKLRYDKDDEICLILSLNKEYINSLCLEILSDTNQSIVILDENNKVLMGSYENREYTTEDQYIISDSIENTNYKILNIFRYDDSYYDKENVIIVVLTMLIIIFSILLLFLLLKSILKPLNELLYKMKRLEKEDIRYYKVVKDNTKSRDEQYILNEEFDKMVIRLKLLIKDIYESKIKEQEIKGRIKELELNALQQQINPHFLYNTLESMFWLAELNSQEEISEMISELGSFFKTSISGNSEYTLIKNEIENAKSYIRLQKIMFDNVFDVIWDVDNEVLGYKSLKLILQPIIENCLIHGLSSKEDKGLIYISCKKINDNVIFEINDNGCGISEEKCKEINDYINSKEDDVKKSVGIKNVNQRIKLYYSEDYGVFIKSKLHIGTFVKIVIPIKG